MTLSAVSTQMPVDVEAATSGDWRLLERLNPWDDRQEFARAAQDLQAWYEDVLRALSRQLDVRHGLSHGLRYWRILVGPWLLYYLHIAYDRYRTLQRALERYPQWCPTLVAYAHEQTPRDLSELAAWSEEPWYYRQLCSQILRGMGCRLPEQRLGELGVELSRLQRPASPPALPRRAVGRAADQVERALSRLLGAHWRVATGPGLMDRGALWRLAWRSGFRVLPVGLGRQWPFEIPVTLSDPARRRLVEAAPLGREPFAQIFATLLPTALPTLYLEGYRQARQAVQRACPTLPPVVVSGDWHFHEPFKFLAAEASARGSRLVAVQHGGGYGIYREAPLERHEAQVSDAYMVWGWARTAEASSSRARHEDLPHPKLSRLLSLKAGGLPRAATAILVVGTSQPRYLYRFHSTPVGSQWEDYFAWAARFLCTMPPQLRRFVTYRRARRDLGYGIRRRITSEVPDVQWDDGSRPLSAGLRASRLVVVDHLSTSLLEALVADVPTILFLDPMRWEVRPSAQPLFEDLRRVGILWDAPEAAAAQVQAVYEQPQAWWRHPAVQEARQRFVEHYALARPDWARQWLAMFRREAAS